MKKLLTYLALILCLILGVIGCGTSTYETADVADVVQQIESDDTTDVSDIDDESDENTIQEADVQPETDSISKEEQDVAEDDESEDLRELSEEVPDETIEEEAIDEDGSYTSPAEVALYIHTYGKLPKNFITKQEAQELGWVSKEGNLDEVAPGMSIGGNRFGNYEQALPDGNYKECDVNYEGGYRGDERLVYSADGAIYYTDDHYATFTQLY